MIFLKQLLREMEEDKNPNIASIEDEQEWKWPDVDHMFAMKFEREGDSVFVLNNPAMKVYKIRKGPFILEEPVENYEETNPKNKIMAPIKLQGISAFEKSKKILKHSFPTFTKLISFFDKYQQDL
jgi:hypothetical protein